MAQHRQEDQKKHAACDECRTRKLKCSGESPSCQRCQTEGFPCVYSLRKKMGRPRKRAREDHDPNDEIDFNGAEDVMSFDINSVAHSQMTGIPGTGIPLNIASRIPLSSFDASSQPVAWLDPLLQDAGIGQSGQEFRPMVPFVDMPNMIPSPSHTPGSSYPTPPNTNGPFTPPPGTCLCLPNLYLTLSDLSATTEWAFPMHVHKLKVSLHTSNSVLECQTCPRELATSVQNLMMLTTLLSTVTDCYRKLLNSIDAHAAKAEAAGTCIQYRMGDSNPERWHLHTGTTDCPMGVNIDLDPPEYKMLARKVIRADVLGTPNVSANQISIMDLLRRLEERQHTWHSDVSCAENKEKFGHAGHQNAHDNGDHTCLKLVATIRGHVAALNL